MSDIRSGLQESVQESGPSVLYVPRLPSLASLVTVARPLLKTFRRIEREHERVGTLKKAQPKRTLQWQHGTSHHHPHLALCRQDNAMGVESSFCTDLEPFVFVRPHPSADRCQSTTRPATRKRWPQPNSKET